jgi:hypothetical protein
MVIEIQKIPNALLSTNLNLTNKSKFINNNIGIV